MKSTAQRKILIVIIYAGLFAASFLCTNGLIKLFSGDIDGGNLDCFVAFAASLGALITYDELEDM